MLEDGISLHFFIAKIKTNSSTVYKFKLDARNQFGWSKYSNEVSFKTAGAFTLRINAMTFNVTINKESVLKLPIAPDI